jgi:hypothetical protein
VRAALIATAVVAALVPAGAASAQATSDPRQGLTPGTESLGGDAATSVTPKRDAATASRGMSLLASRDKPAYTGVAPAFNYSNINSDLAFQGRYAYSGNYRGFGVYDVSDPADPQLKATVNCVGGQGDVSVQGDLLFMSVESGSARTDCLPGWRAARLRRLPWRAHLRHQRPARPRAPRRRPDLPRLAHPHDRHAARCHRQAVDLQLRHLRDPCGHPAGGLRTGVDDAGDLGVQHRRDRGPAGRAGHRPRRRQPSGDGHRHHHRVAQPGGRQATLPADDPRASAPGNAPGGQTVAATSACHDITAYPAIGLAAGACQGDGLLLDIRDAANPVRIANVTDPNFAYWHSATFNDAGTKVVFTDEWGGGGAARCSATYTTGSGANAVTRPTPTNWGANAIFDIVTAADGTRSLEWRSYYKIPNNQASNEICVAHNGNLVPVPGRDVMVQAWYEGGTSVFDFTDSAAPKEIALFDRGPYAPAPVFHGGGYWSTYWYNGAVFGNEIFLGFDSWGLTSTGALSTNEIEAAGLARVGTLNAQAQEPIRHTPSFTLVRARFDQAVRAGSLTAAQAAEVTKFVDRAEGFAARNKQSARATLNAKAGELTGPGQQALAAELRRLAGSL